jgi:hypothetical protein
MTEPGVKMILIRGSRRLQENGSISTSNNTNCTQVWQDAIRDRILEEVKTVLPLYETTEVDLFNVSKVSDADTLALFFDVLIAIRSPVQENDVYRYIEGPFDSQVEKNKFAEFLRSTGCPEFANVTNIEIIVPRATEQIVPKSESSSPSVGLIVGLALATAAILTLGATFILVRIRKRRRLDDADDDYRYAHASPFVPDNHKEFSYEFASEIGLNANTDVSTLGDPISPGESARDEFDMSTMGSVDVDYDYQKAYVDVQSVTDSQVVGSTDGSLLHRTGASLDDPSLLSSDIVTATGDSYSFGSRFGSEERYEVVAPSGLLGLILESNTEDRRPTVNNVKATSVLAHVVKVGDHVVSVDGQDVTAMRASDVSRLIALKKDKSRVLVFSRPVKRSTYSIQEDDSEEE